MEAKSEPLQEHQQQQQTTSKRKLEDVDQLFEFKLPFDSTASGLLEEEVKRAAEVTTCFWSTATPLQDDDVEDETRTLSIMLDYHMTQEQAIYTVHQSMTALDRQCDFLLDSIQLQLKRFHPEQLKRKALCYF